MSSQPSNLPKSEPVKFAVKTTQWQHENVIVNEHEYVGEAPPDAPRFSVVCTITLAMTPQGPLNYRRSITIPALTPLAAIQWILDNKDRLEAETKAQGNAELIAQNKKVQVVAPSEMQKIGNMQRIGMA